MKVNQEKVRDKAFIGGKWLSSDKVFSVYNPASGAELAQVADVGAEGATQAILAAERAFPLWAAFTPQERADILYRWAALIKNNVDSLSNLMSLEQGKPLQEARSETLGAAETIRWCAEEGRRLYGEFIDAPQKSNKIIISRHPVGVVAAITPWNFPISMITRKVGPALAAGCTVVLKPAEATPLCALALADLAQKAGLPDGVLNVVTSAKSSEVGKVLTSDSRVKKLSFTGSTQTGRKLMAQAAENIQKLSLELGGNAPFIVFPSADLDQAVEGAIASKFRNAGQTCICANRIYVHSDIFDRFQELFCKKIKDLRVGPGNQGVDIGPLINSQAIDKIEKMISSAKQSGGKILCGGQRHALGGNFFEPTVMIDVPETASIATEEIFGPVAVLYEFSEEADVILRANNTPYGLAAYLYSRDMGQIWRVSDALEYGMVGVNEPLLANDLAPFGGVKHSGFGREGGRYGLEEYLNVKYRLFRN